LNNSLLELSSEQVVIVLIKIFEMFILKMNFLTFGLAINSNLNLAGKKELARLALFS